MGIFDAFGTGDQRDAANAQINGINTGLAQLTGAIGTGNDQLTTNYMAGLKPFMQNFNTGSSGATAYGNALGLNGPRGSMDATQAFMNNPAYAWNVQQGNNAITASNAASGKTGSGNEALALSNYNSGQAANGWNSYLANLQPFLNMATSAASGIGGLYSGLGNMLNANSNTIGNAAYGANTSIGNANANADLAGLGASSNILGAGLGLGGALLGFLSDERAKSDIEPVGEMYDGQIVYRYRYNGDPRHQLGLIAQDVVEDVPDATFHIPGLDMMGVDYKRATDLAADLGRYL